MSEINCDVEEKKCKTSTKYKKSDIVDLAIKCGIEPGKKSRNQLCEEIVKLNNEETPRSSSSRTSRSTSRRTSRSTPDISKKTKNELIQIAESMGITKINNRSIKYLNKDVIFKAIQDNTPEEESPIASQRGSPRASSRPSSRPSSPRASPRASREDYKLELINKKLTELNNLLKQTTIKSNKPTKKADIIEYLSALESNDVCDPENNQFCEDGLSCDVANKPGLCIADSVAESRNLEQFMYNNKKLVGNTTAINVLKKKLDSSRSVSSRSVSPRSVSSRSVSSRSVSSRSRSGSPRKPILPYLELPPPLDLEQKSASAMAPSPKMTLFDLLSQRQGIEESKIDYSDIETVLREIQYNKDPSDKLSNEQLEILKCLGLLS